MSTRSAHSPSQTFVEVRDVKDGIVTLKNGKLCIILMASSINFALKSLEEQQAILYQFQQFLNTLDFSLQIYVQSRRLNINPYLEKLKALESKQDNDLMRVQLREYIEFIRTFTTEVSVMNKSFYVVVPYAPSKINLTQTFTNALSKPNTAATADTTFAEQRVQLEQRVAVVEEGLNRIGIRTAALSDNELVELFYHTYNPANPNSSAPLIK
jgi:type IV secretory pathway VirB4 component